MEQLQWAWFGAVELQVFLAMQAIFNDSSTWTYHRLTEPLPLNITTPFDNLLKLQKDDDKNIYKWIF